MLISLELCVTQRRTCESTETIYSTQQVVPRKISNLSKFNTRIEYNHYRGLVGLPGCCWFRFNTSLSSILYRPLRKILSWMATISSACTFSTHKTRHSIISTDSPLLYWIVRSRLIPALTTFNDSPTLRTTAFSRNIAEVFLEIYTGAPTERNQHHYALF